MSTNQTQHLHLSQWEENDEILRADFNSDNAKLDTALAALNAVADVAYTPNSKPFVAGSYTGNGASERVISLGFTPSAVLLVSAMGEMYNFYSSTHRHHGGLTLPGCPGVDNRKKTILSVVEGGFQVANGSESPYSIQLNGSGNYYYIAFR